MYGSVIKNAELLDNSYKIMHLENYMCGMNMLYAMMIKVIELINENLKFEELSNEEKNNMGITTKEELEQMKTKMLDISKLMFPIAVQNMILENVGTPKLESAINELIQRNINKPFEKFMLTFLKCDLKKLNLKNSLMKYIQEEKSKSILKIILIKLTFYYKIRFFGNNVKIDGELIDLITEIQMKLNPQKKQNFYKSQISKDKKFQLDQQLLKPW